MSDSDYETIQNMIDRGGSFAHYIGLAASRADLHNLRRLKRAFPDLWETYHPSRWSSRYWR